MKPDVDREHVVFFKIIDRYLSCPRRLYKISLKDGSRPIPEVQQFSLDVSNVLNPVIPFLILVGNLRPNICKGASSTGYGLFSVSFNPLDGSCISASSVSVSET